MTTAQLAKRLGVKQPSVVAIEQSEVKGTIALATLRRLSVTISDSASGECITDREFLDTVRAEAAALGYVPSLEDVQQAMSKIPGSLTADFMAEREERGF